MENPSFKLKAVVKSKDEMADFEGPLSLILALLSKNKIEIRDISVSEILDQYLAQIAQMQELDMEVASEFVQMAAYLLYIKTKTLLETEKEVTELEQLMASLEQLRCRDTREAVRSVVPELSEASERGLLLYTRKQEPLRKQPREYTYRHEPAELLEALFAVFSTVGVKTQSLPELRALAPKRIVYSVRAKCGELLERLSKNGKLSLSEIFDEGRSRSELVATFISVLEMCSAGAAELIEEDRGPVLSYIGGGMEGLLENYDD